MPSMPKGVRPRKSGSAIVLLAFQSASAVAPRPPETASVGSPFQSHWKRPWQTGFASSEAPETVLPIELPFARTRPAITAVP